MGRRDELELTPSDAELAEAETATRDLLARYGEPVPAQPPPGLVSRVLAAMPEEAPGPQARRPWWAFPRPVAAWGLGLVAAMLIIVGGLAALVGAAARANVAASPDGLLGRLTAALAGRPLVGALAAPFPAAILISLGLVVAGIVWWGLRRRR
jgi:hypothetical protein